MKGKIVVDLGFGDGGKGMLIDNLCADTPDSLVVRFSGGQQAGHTVIDSVGNKHIFSSFGAGTLAGADSFFTEDTTMYLPALMREHTKLVNILGISPRLFLHPRVMVTTPYDIAYNRARETLRGAHGSCGMGVGATMKRCIETPYKLFVQDLEYLDLCGAKLSSIYSYYKQLIGDDHELLKEFMASLVVLLTDFYKSLDEHQKERVCFEIATLDELHRRKGYTKNYSQVVFEGSQGVMLDMDHGVFPNVTYANTTSKNVWKYINRLALTPEMYYVTRCYTTRHGLGWMPTENNIDLINTKEEINVSNGWQGGFRIGDFDYDMINHALATDASYHENWDPKKHFVLSCLDQRPDFVLNQYMIYDICEFIGNRGPNRGNLGVL